jgi:hypothetical protein
MLREEGVYSFKHGDLEMLIYPAELKEIDIKSNPVSDEEDDLFYSAD